MQIVDMNSGASGKDEVQSTHVLMCYLPPVSKTPLFSLDLKNQAKLCVSTTTFPGTQLMKVFNIKEVKEQQKYDEKRTLIKTFRKN